MNHHPTLHYRQGKRVSTLLALVLAATLSICQTASALKKKQQARYEPTWDSLDARPLPLWFEDAKFGIFIHWGVFSVPGYGTEWMWYRWKTDEQPDVVEYMQNNYPPTWSYQAFAPMFTASLFDPGRWLDIFLASGAKYVVLTSKHHDGYTLYPSKYSANWNSDVGPGRDLIAELQRELHKTDIRFGLYHSLYEWYHPLYLQDKGNNWTTNDFVRLKTGPELYELVDRYHPDVIWSDGDWEAPGEYWNSTFFLQWLYNDSPVKRTVVTNDRWGKGISCHHGGFYSCEDRYSPGTLQQHKYESCQTLDKRSWGYRHDAKLSDFLSVKEIIQELVKIVATNGNLLLNIGPDKDGIISPIYEERLRQVGSWLQVNGQGIFSTRPWWKAQNDSVTSTVWYTADKEDTIVYAILLEWPIESKLVLGAPTLTTAAAIPSTTLAATEEMRRVAEQRRVQEEEEEEELATVTLLGYGDLPLSWKEREDGEGGGIVIDLQSLSSLPEIPKTDWAWTFVLKGFV